MSIQVHGYYWSCKALQTRLEEFIGGQCQSRRREEKDQDYVLRRGEILKFEVQNDIKRIRVYFEWLCKQHEVFDKTAAPWKTRLKWSPQQKPPNPSKFGPSYLDIDFTFYWYQSDEGRLKMWGGGYGEVCRFFQKDDHTNLVKVAGDEYVEYCIFQQLNLWRAIMIALRQQT